MTGIFLEKFSDTELAKDPGLIAAGLIERGVSIKIFSHQPSISVAERFSTTQISVEERNQPEYWKRSGIDSLIIYSWLSLRYSRLISAAKQAGLKVVLKLDSDGHLIYPDKPSYLKVFGLDSSLRAKLIHLLRLGQWTFFPKTISRKKIRQIEESDAVIIETPAAARNLQESLRYWKRDDLLAKIHTIPNPVTGWSEDISTKTNTIAAIGRWGDRRKNAPAVIATIASLDNDWQIKLVGEGSSALADQITRLNPKIAVQAVENMPHDAVLQLLAETKILFAPSIAESYNLAVAESLCCGCTFVGGPLPSFRYFARDGFSGKIADNLESQSLGSALKAGIQAWNEGKYFPAAIAAFWRKEIGLPTISQKIHELLISL